MSEQGSEVLIGEGGAGLNTSIESVEESPRRTGVVHRSPAPVGLFKNGRAEKSRDTNELHMLLSIKQVDKTPLPKDTWVSEIIFAWIGKQTAVSPTGITILNRYDALVEFDDNVLVTGVSRILQKVTSLRGMGVQVTCIVDEANECIQVAGGREARRRTPSTSRESSDELQRDMLRALSKMQDQMTQLQAEVKASKEASKPDVASGVFYTPSFSLDGDEEVSKAPKPEEDKGVKPFPTIPSVAALDVKPKSSVAGAELTADASVAPVASTSTYADNRIKLKLPVFSGDEKMEKHESDFKNWLFKVSMLITVLPEARMKQVIIDSLRGSAAELVMFLGLETPVATIIERMKNQFGDVSSADVLMTRFYELRQGKTERIATFYSRLVATLEQIKRSCPGSVDEATASQHLKHRLWFGMHNSSRNALRYLYDQSTVTHQQLLTACRALEAESGLNTVRVKGATVSDLDSGVVDNECEVTVQSKAANYEERGRPQERGNAKQGDRGSSKQNNSNNSNGKNNGKNGQKGKSRRKGKEIQCYACQGYGHVRRECPTWLKAQRGQKKEGDLPPKQEQQVGTTPTETTTTSTQSS